MMNDTAVLLFSLISLLLLPNIVIVLDGDVKLGKCYKELVIVGDECYKYAISDLIITLQAVITTLRVLPLYRKIKRYGLNLSRDVRDFIAWWVVSVLFVIFASLNSMVGVRVTAIDIFCHLVFMAIVSIGFLLLGRGIDMRPVTEDKEHVELDAFVGQSKEMGRRLSSLIDEECGKVGFSSENAIEALGTNRTYFFRMVKIEFGCQFSELLKKRRIEKVKKLLKTTDYGMAVIAEMCGFSGASYMIKVFKSLEGVTPKEYRDRKIVN